ERIRPKTFSTTNISNDILFKDIIGMSPKIIELKEKMEVIAKTNVPAQIMGESGTGKELVAYALHQASGDYFTENGMQDVLTSGPAMKFLLMAEEEGTELQVKEITLEDRSEYTETVHVRYMQGGRE